MYEIPIAVDCSFVEVDTNIPVSQPVSIKIIPEVVIPVEVIQRNQRNEMIQRNERHESLVLNVYKICATLMTSLVVVIVVSTIFYHHI